MSEENKISTERLTNAMSLSNLADRLKAQMITGPSLPLNQESNDQALDKPANELPKQ